MESVICPLAPCTERDRAVLEVMERLGWGITIPRIAEYTGLDEDDVKGSLRWLKSQGEVEPRFNDKQGLTYWYLKKADRDSPMSPVCGICGKRCKNAQGLAIHMARAHGVGHEGELHEANDTLTMEVPDEGAVKFVQDLIAHFATLPEAEISVTIKFSKGAKA